MAISRTTSSGRSGGRTTTRSRRTTTMPGLKTATTHLGGGTGSGGGGGRRTSGRPLQLTSLAKQMERTNLAQQRLVQEQQRTFLMGEKLIGEGYDATQVIGILKTGPWYPTQGIG